MKKNKNIKSKDLLREYIIDLYQHYGLGAESNSKVYKHYDEIMEKGLLVPHENSRENFKRKCRRVRQFLLENSFYDKDQDENDVIKHNLSLMKQKQKLVDKNTLNNKELREKFRTENTLEELNRKLIDLISEHGFKTTPVKSLKYKPEDRTLVVGISDCHFGAEINLEGINTYNYEIACKRLTKYKQEIDNVCTSYRIKKIVIMMLGDQINASKRLSKVIENTDVSSKVVFVASHILGQFIESLAEKYDVSVNFIIGNESFLSDTFNDSIPYNNYLMANNWDLVLANILQIMFKNHKRIKFYSGSLDERVINIHGKNILMTHGNTFVIEKTADVDKLIRKYSVLGINLDMIISGHYHSSYTKDVGVECVRSSSLIGQDDYSYQKHYSGKAGQVLAIISKDSITSIHIDLQNTDSIKEFYDYPKDAVAFNKIFNPKADIDKKVIVIK